MKEPDTPKRLVSKMLSDAAFDPLKSTFYGRSGLLTSFEFGIMYFMRKNEPKSNKRNCDIQLIIPEFLGAQTRMTAIITWRVLFNTY